MPECQDCQGRVGKVAGKEGGGIVRRPEPDDFPAGAGKRAILPPR